VDGIGDVFTSHEGSRWLADSGDVPMSAKANGRCWPLGRYLRKRMAKASGITDEARLDIYKERIRREFSGMTVLESIESRTRRERARKQHARNAIARARISNSTKRGGSTHETQ